MEISLCNTYACIEHFIPKSTVELLRIRFCKSNTKVWKVIDKMTVFVVNYGKIQQAFTDNRLRPGIATPLVVVA